ncbi:hypothetical protein [Hymenobacter sp. B1770]
MHALKIDSGATPNFVNTASTMVATLLVPSASTVAVMPLANQVFCHTKA